MLKVKNAGRGKEDYSVKPEKINLEEYKNLLLRKLKDTLEIAGFNMNDLRKEAAATTIITVDNNNNNRHAIDKFRGGSF